MSHVCPRRLIDHHPYLSHPTPLEHRREDEDTGKPDPSLFSPSKSDLMKHDLCVSPAVCFQQKEKKKDSQRDWPRFRLSASSVVKWPEMWKEMLSQVTMTQVGSSLFSVNGLVLMPMIPLSPHSLASGLASLRESFCQNLPHHPARGWQIKRRSSDLRRLAVCVPL